MIEGLIISVELRGEMWSGTSERVMALCRTTQKSDLVSETVVQMLLELWHEWVPTSLGSLFQCLTTVWVKIFLISNLTLLWLSSTLFPQALLLSSEDWNQHCHDAPLIRTCIPFPTTSHSSHSHSLSSLLCLQSDRSVSNRMLYNYFFLFHYCFSLKISKAWKTSWE